MVKLKYNLIGLSGRLGNGKDLVGSIINYITHLNYEELETKRGDIPLIQYIENINGNFPRYDIKKYADKLKDICCLILGCTREQLEDREFKEKPIPHLTKYEVSFKYIYPIGTITSRPEKITFPTEDEANNFIENGLYDGLTIVKESCKVNPIYVTPRDIQNRFGTDCGRNMIHSNIWCEALFADYKGRVLNKFENPNVLEGYMHKSCRYCEKQYIGYKRQLHCNDCADEIGEIFPNWLITDVRFSDNEGKYIKDRGGIVIGIKRKFSLRFPEYSYLEDEENPYDIPDKLKDVDMTLYKRLTSDSEVSMGNFDWCDYIIENNGSIEELVEKIKEIVWD